jgi:hypothetical protein
MPLPYEGVAAVSWFGVRGWGSARSLVSRFYRSRNRSSIIGVVISNPTVRSGWLMQRRKAIWASSCAFYVGLGFAGPVTLSGCDGGSDKPEMLKPDQPPSVTSKDSMNEYLKNVPKKGAAKAKP